MKNYDIEADRSQIADLFMRYVKIILHEYKDKVPTDIKEKLSKITDFKDLVQIENTGTISLFAKPSDSTIHLPLDAYKAIQALSQFPEYGLDKSHQTHDKNNMIINDNTYRDFVEHVILKGETPVEYFREILLHEVMHICGSGGSSALAEGFNELKTRELASKYGLETSCCGYPKETKIAFELQQIFGKEICDKLAFSQLKERFTILREELGEEAVSLYADVYANMEHQFRPYMNKNYPGVAGIKEKCDTYDKIDYSKVYDSLNQYKKQKEENKLLSKKRGFVNQITLNFLIGFSISIFFLLSLILFPK